MAVRARWSELDRLRSIALSGGESSHRVIQSKKREIRIEGDIAYVPLTKGFEAVIDVDDVPLVSMFNWHARVKPGASSYAAFRIVRPDGVRADILMHRLIAQTPDHLDTDHRDGNGLNNRRSNLRNATKSQNMHNARQRVDNSSGYKGVCWHKKKSKWVARIRLNGRQHHLGYFSTPQDAHEAYRQASDRMHGEFSRLA